MAHRMELARRSLDRARGTAIERTGELYRDLLAQVNEREPEMLRLDDAGLRAHAARLRRRADAGERLDSMRGEAFALVRETARRTLGQRPYDVQLLAAAALSDGHVAEMHTGEGKTLAAVPALHLGALARRGAHLLTFNDYLARRDAEWMRPLYERLGLTVGVVQEGRRADARRAAYAADVTYLTAKEAGFDFLRDQHRGALAERVQRGHAVAIVDEADSILIDEARVPLVLAGEAPGLPREELAALASLVSLLERGSEVRLDAHARNVHLTETGLERVERELGRGSLHQPDNAGLLTAVHGALHALHLLQPDRDYIVRDGRVEIVDELTGRVADGRRWPDGLQAAVEARHGLTPGRRGRVLGSITLQHFLARYRTLAGMTATARPAASELRELYGVTVVTVPRHRTCVRADALDRMFADRRSKLEALLRELATVHATGRPVLVGTASVEESDALERELARRDIPCRVLNARTDALEADVIAEAGALGAVTISTNMAGRGTDIRLGGRDGTTAEAVRLLGGLYVIGTNRHESRRIDDQLRGRAGRQGDPGSSRFFVSLEDPLMVRYGIAARLAAGAVERAARGPIDDPEVGATIDHVQRIVEGQHQDVRRTLWRYASAVERRRRWVEELREALLADRELRPLPDGPAPESWRELARRLRSQVTGDGERRIALASIDHAWSDYLGTVAEIRDGIHLVRLGGREPLDVFSRELASAFRGLADRIAEDVGTELSRARTDASADPAGPPRPSSTWTYQVDDRFHADWRGAMMGADAAVGAAVGLGLVLHSVWLLPVWLLARLRRWTGGPRG